MKRYFSILLLAVFSLCMVLFMCTRSEAGAIGTGPGSPSIVMMINWISGNIQYSGLLEMRSNGTGTLWVQYYLPGVGPVKVRQIARLNNQYDMFGNCTSFITCSVDCSIPPTMSYSPDHFVIYPNGNMFTMDSMGNWSTLIQASPVPGPANQYRHYF